MDAATRLRYRLEPLLAEISQSAGIPPPRLHITRFGSSARIGIDHPEDHTYITYPASKSGHQTDLEIRGILGHELSHLTLGHVSSETVPQWMRSQPRIAATALAALVFGIAAVSLIGILIGGEPLHLYSDNGMNSVPILLGAILGGLPLAIYTWAKAAPHRPGWDGTTSAQRELAADVAAVRLVGREAVLAATTSQLPRTRLGRWNDRLVDGPFRVLATHPSTQYRLEAIIAYRGQDPKTYSSTNIHSSSPP
jgi:hypothetical protein